MSTILTDDELKAECRVGFGIDPVLDGNLIAYARAVEGAVLAKLAQLEPVGYMSSEGRVISAGLVNRYPEYKHDCPIPLYTHPAPMQADRQRVPDELDWRHPRIQALIGADARSRICIDLVWRILENPRGEFTASDMEYWDKLHDKVQEVALAAAPEAPVQADQTKYFLDPNVSTTLEFTDAIEEAPAQASEVDGRAALTGTERQPLPQWQIDEIIKQHTGGFIGGMHFVHLARAIEIAHGIGGKDCQPLTQWQPIETAPKNGTVIDLWHEEFGRYAGCFWGKPIHSCGEMGRFCDSDWHSLKDGWVDEFNEQHPESEFTHWMPLPAAPDAAPEAPAQANDWTPLAPEEQDRLDGLLKHARWLAESMPTMEGLQHSWALNARQVMARMHDWLNRYLPPATPCVPKKPCAVDERDRKDAERYRWLTEDHEKFETRALVCEIASALSVRGKGNIDAAIDAALAQKGGK